MEAKRVYLDSSIWISHILQEKRNNRAQTVQRLFHQIEEDEGVILISHLVLLEVLEVIRKRITESEPYTDLGDDKKKEIKDKVQEKTGLFLEILSRFIRDHRVALIDSQKPVDQWFKATYSIFVSSSGDISAHNYYPDGRRRAPPKYQYRGVGHYDIQHALTAQEFSAGDLHTFDHGFVELEGALQIRGCPNLTACFSTWFPLFLHQVALSSSFFFSRSYLSL